MGLYRRALAKVCSPWADDISGGASVSVPFFTGDSHLLPLEAAGLSTDCCVLPGLSSLGLLISPESLLPWRPRNGDRPTIDDIHR
jgi:hypothetical protein